MRRTATLPAPERLYLPLDTPVGPVFLSADGEWLTELRYGALPAGVEAGRTPLLDEAARQLEAYFAGRLRAFDLPLRPEGTPFQRLCWDALREIPYGETRAYADIAARIGRPRACRAVGMANNRNPISILIPCHRVVGRDGRLVGYGGGLAAKEWLLRLEREG